MDHFRMPRYHVLLMCTFLASLAALSRAMRCEPGTILSEKTNMCEPCPPGTYRSSGDQTKCLSCPPGTFQPYSAAAHPSLCRRCPRNYFSSKPSSASCQACPSGQASGYGATRCVRCAKGQVASFFGNTCRTCPQDTYVDSVETTIGGGRIFDCIDCPVGFHSPSGSTSIKACKPCKPGQNCYLCPQNTYFVKTGDCHPCPVGTQSKKGSTSISQCTPCPPGSARLFRAPRSCTPCSASSTAVVSGAAACKTKQGCPKGTVESVDGICISCPSGSRLVRTAKGAQCSKCPSGSVSSGGLCASCMACSGGTVPNLVGDTCVCMSGEFLTKGGACAKCPKGSAQKESFHRYSGCEPCEVGTVAQAGASKCMRCSDGLVANDDNSACRACKNGSMPDLLSETDLLEGFGHSTCVSTSSGCAASYEKRRGSPKYSYCEPVICSNGTPASSVGKSCKGCEPGEFATVDWRGVRVCDICPSDSTSAGGVVSKCTKCPNGTARDENRGNRCTCNGLNSLGFGFRGGVCQECLPGTFSDYGSNVCSPCKSGTFAAKSGAWRCQKCPSGSVAKSGMSKCTKCPADTIPDMDGQRCLLISWSCMYGCLWECATDDICISVPSLILSRGASLTPRAFWKRCALFSDAVTFSDDSGLLRGEVWMFLSVLICKPCCRTRTQN